jgi:hypothetical protein
MERVSGDSEHRSPIAFRVVQPIQQMNSAGTGSCDTNTQAPCELSVTACRESSRFLVPDLNEFDLVLPRAKSFEDAVDTIPWKSEHYVNAPVNQAVGE